MLVLTRKPNESVYITDEIKVTVDAVVDEYGNAIRGSSAKLGFEAPPSANVKRAELDSRLGHDGHGRGSKRRHTRLAGTVANASNATVVLSIIVPPKLPIRWNGERVLPFETDQGASVDDGQTGKESHRLVCNKDDRITICHNLGVTVLAVSQFVPANSRTPANT